MASSPFWGATVEKKRSIVLNNKKLIGYAREMRKHMTPQEFHLWRSFLRNYPFKFYRQRIIDLFIADFYCAKAKLVIELDGSGHYTAYKKISDEVRTKHLNKLGIKVLRFANTEVDNNFYGVCQVIDNAVKIRLEIIAPERGDGTK